jgi:hypothetical protein
MINTVNYDGMSVWWQMTNLPDYMRTWQVFSQMYNKFISQDFLTFYYADLCWSGYFENAVYVFEYVIPTSAGYTAEQ